MASTKNFNIWCFVSLTIPFIDTIWYSVKNTLILHGKLSFYITASPQTVNNPDQFSVNVASIISLRETRFTVTKNQLNKRIKMKNVEKQATATRWGRNYLGVIADDVRDARTSWRWSREGLKRLLDCGVDELVVFRNYVRQIAARFVEDRNVIRRHQFRLHK